MDTGKRATVFGGLGLGALTSVVAVAILYLGSRAADLPFAPFDVFELVTRRLPGAVVDWGIEAMVAIIRGLGVGPTSVAAKAAEEVMAVAMFVGGSAVLGAIAAAASRWIALVVACIGAAAVWLAIVVVSELTVGTAAIVGIVWVAVVLFGWALLLAWSLATTAPSAEPSADERADRRRFVGGLVGGVAAGSAALVGIAALFRRRGAKGDEAEATGTGQLTSATSGSPPPEVLARREAPVPGTRAEITPNARFYRIDIDLAPPRVDAAAWKLRVDGLVDEPLDLSLERIRALPAVTQLVTLECISNPVGGDLISTSQWTGVRLRDVLRLGRASGRTRAIHIEAADGYYESVGIEDANDDRTMLVYAMGGAALAHEHGFPLRIYIPNRYGMKQPKWITRLHVSDREGRGYWVDRGWSKEAVVQTTSVIDTVRSSMMIGEAKTIPVGGIAYAGARGISKVEVQVDDGPWAEAKLIAPALGALTWVLWRYDWPYVPGRHTFRVRAYDGTGALQPTREHGPRPDGATGIHEITMNV